MKIKYFRGLFFKAVFVLSLISAVLACVIGFHVMRVDSRILQNEVLQKEESAYAHRSVRLYDAGTVCD